MRERSTVQGFIRSKGPNKKEIFAKAKPAENVSRGDMIQGQVYNVTEDGAFIITPQDYIGFFHKSELTEPVEIGRQVEGRVTFVRPDGRINLSMRPLKEVGRLTDAEKILEYLKKRQGNTMPYGDTSSPEMIQEQFKMSKGAFKRALGKLLKDGLIEQKEGWTILKNLE